MAANAFVRARIDETLKNRITLTKVAKEKALPFDMRVPNELTANTIANSEKGVDVHTAKDADDLFNQLGI
ncbi:type II toxin-antitoxin system RelB/DinJ family antitoxin [Klebsiella pneumoniae]|uniref:type II toxin-antitoxin system RelB/DinJ family antitoxin n=1 Tax=Klebsiella pneumoniae TaxID=573 RepID=UPI000E2D5227|nr:type II toxin-antitoxin system RelB/DinJ family antitoxin [Klebsiella pneumoniae]SWI21530.1 Antitoxin DinJ [Klebsiella pneumoniae]